MISVEKVRNINSYETFVNFLKDEIAWPIPYDVKHDRLTYEYFSDELGLSEQDLKHLEGTSIKQLIPFQENQPWGIFLLELATPTAYTTLLRKVIRGLVPGKKKSSTISSWHHENILLICTYNYEHFTFARFEGEHYSNAKITTFSWSPDEPIRTLCEHNLPALKWPADDGQDAGKWLKDWGAAFDVEKVTKKFYESYKYVLREVLEKAIAEANKGVDITGRKIWAFSQQLLNRMMFIYFLQKKHWIKWGDGTPDTQYLISLWKKYKETSCRDEFYNIWLSSLFFHAFTNKKSLLPPNLPGDIRASYINMPFLNGGLFEPNELDEIGLNVPDKVFESIYGKLLDHYNFTIKEDTPLDVEVAVDPEMLGKVYESLVFESERSAGGIFYTPREEIDLMCKMSLIEHLAGSTNIDKENIIKLVMEPDNKIHLDSLNDNDKRNVAKELENIKVVDPAAGSGSFLVRMMDILVELQKSIQTSLGEHPNTYALKRKIILDSLYGVDIKRWAIRVAELRLWLSLIIEADEHELDKYNVPLLPNFTFKLRQGDALIDEIAGIPISLRKLVSTGSQVKKKIEQINEKKFLYYQGDKSITKKDIEKDEKDLLRNILADKINQINEKIKFVYDSEKKEFALKADKQLELLKTEKEQADLLDMLEQKRKAENEKKIEKLRAEKRKFEEIISGIKANTDKDYFLWDVDFAEVFFGDKKGFDIVIGNPPYVRQEEIAPPLKHEEDSLADDWRAVKKAYKEQLANSVKELWDSAGTINKKSDLYVYFYYQGLSLLREGGAFCFINSNSWLDVGYGEGLQQFLLSNLQPEYIIDNSSERSFEAADVNTVIVLIKRPPKNFSKDYPIKFINFKKPFAEVSTVANLLQIQTTSDRHPEEQSDEGSPTVIAGSEESPTVIPAKAGIQANITKTDDFRIYNTTPQELWLDGQNPPTSTPLEKDKSPVPPFSKGGQGGLVFNWENQQYKGGKWGGKYLRAPDIYFKILEKGKDKLVRLGDIAEVRRGFTTGANEFFYLEPTGEPAPKGLIHVKNSAGWHGFLEEEFLKPVLKSPREVKTIEVKLEDLKYKVFMCNKSKEQLKKEGKTHALEYIEWGEQSIKDKKTKQETRAFHKRPTCASRTNWWWLGNSHDSLIAWAMMHAKLHNVYINYARIELDHNFFEIIPNDNANEISLAAVCCSTSAIFIKELFGRHYGGGSGPLKNEGIDIVKFAVVKPDLMISDSTLISVIKTFSKREQSPVFDEIGLSVVDKDYSNISSDDVSIDKVLPDRRALDKIIFEAIGLTEDEQLEVYRAVVDLVKSRLTKAQTF